MAPGFDAKIFFCILVITCYCTVTLAQMPIDCCLEVSNKPIGKSFVINYHRQIAGKGCAIDATVLETRGGRTLCVIADAQWLTLLKQHVDKLKRDCKKTKYMGRRCAHVKRE
ncbi:C-C motif chemokine 19a.1 [Anabas testudineus]|uniref:Chemokine interleukin-8-like domain-containing protein n=1 Tax=Anabas testudineus TaxID=64144 RepID=A0A3Q1I2G7_ANATE|nr:C-C motif chemokine 19a.1 [Anabas testudineus]